MQRGGVDKVHQTHSPSVESRGRRQFSDGLRRERACGAASGLWRFRYVLMISITFSVLCVHCMIPLTAVEREDTTLCHQQLSVIV
jgi:hypothetical protein